MTEDTWYNPYDKRFKWTPERLEEVAKSLNDWIDKSIESGEDFLLSDWAFHSKLGFLPSYFSRYCERSIALDSAYNRAKEWQEHNISKGALFNKLNGKFASLWLSHAHGWKTNNEEGGMKRLGNDFGNYVDLQRQKYDEENPQDS